MHMAEELFPDAQHILDLYHLKRTCMHFQKASSEWREGEYIPWAEREVRSAGKRTADQALAIWEPGENICEFVQYLHQLHFHAPGGTSIILNIRRRIFLGSGQ